MEFGQEYAWALGFSVAQGSLVNVANDIGAYNRREAGGKLYPVGITSSNVDPYPIRDVPLSGYVRGDGMVNVYWEMVLGILGWQHMRTVYFDSGADVAVNMTIYTRRHDLGTYQRYNPIAEQPGPASGTLAYLRNNTVAVRVNFRDLQEL